MNNIPIIIERRFNAPLLTVWKAISDKDEMKKWYFDLPEFRAEVGSTFQFTGGPDGGIQYVHLCEVTEVIQESKLTYSWRYDGYAGNSLVSFELFSEEVGTLLRLTHSGIETFPEENPDLAKHNFIAGWDHIVNISLKGFLEGSKDRS